MSRGINILRGVQCISSTRSFCNRKSVPTVSCLLLLAPTSPTCLLSVSINLTMTGRTYKWNHRVFVLLLISCGSGSRTHFFLRIDARSTGAGCPMIFLRSSVRGHVGCVYILTLVNNTAMNRDERGSLHTVGFQFLQM